MKGAYVFLADGFEEVEALTVVDILRRAGIETKTVSMGKTTAVEGSHGIRVEADLLFEEAEAEAELFVLPGGLRGTKLLAAHSGLADRLKKADAEGRKIAAICAAPTVLGGLGLLNGRTATCYPGMEAALTGAKTTEDSVVVSGNITTSRGMGTSVPFALSLVAQLLDQEKADGIAAGIVWK